MCFPGSGVPDLTLRQVITSAGRSIGQNVCSPRPLRPLKPKTCSLCSEDRLRTWHLAVNAQRRL
eukprot:scaffold49982_cov24-Phaeocystis_antarctica.AAC.1